MQTRKCGKCCEGEASGAVPCSERLSKGWWSWDLKDAGMTQPGRTACAKACGWPRGRGSSGERWKMSRGTESGDATSKLPGRATAGLQGPLLLITGGLPAVVVNPVQNQVAGLACWVWPGFQAHLLFPPCRFVPGTNHRTANHGPGCLCS